MLEVKYYLKFGKYMSRVGKQIITIPQGTQITADRGIVSVKGPQGDLKRIFKDVVEICIAENEVTLKPKNEEKETRALWGTYASHIKNMVDGVNEHFSKKLIIEGVGYRAEMKGSKLVLSVGFSHPVEYSAPEGVTIEVQKAEISVSGANKEDVGRAAAEIRAIKKPEPYKGKGIRYSDEVVRRKEGKKSV